MQISEERLRDIIREELRAILEPADEQPVGVEELASYLKLAPYTVRSQAQRGDLPGAKIGRVWRFYISEVRAHLTPPSVVDPWQRSPRSIAAHKAAVTRARNGNAHRMRMRDN